MLAEQKYGGYLSFQSVAVNIKCDFFVMFNMRVAILRMPIFPLPKITSQRRLTSMKKITWKYLIDLKIIGIS